MYPFRADQAGDLFSRALGALCVSARDQSQTDKKSPVWDIPSRAFGEKKTGTEFLLPVSHAALNPTPYTRLRKAGSRQRGAKTMSDWGNGIPAAGRGEGAGKLRGRRRGAGSTEHVPSFPLDPAI
jgi:hypothetical protein